MATIDGFLLGGRPDSEGCADYGAAIAYSLRTPCQASRSDGIDGWIVESAAGKSTIVARSTQAIGRQEVIAAGTECIQRYLDLLSYERFKVSELAGIGDGHVMLYTDGDRRVVEVMVTDDLVLGVSATGVVYDRDGNPKPTPPGPPPVWTPALRFYRLSQASGDLYEAYRNLWLGLEALLSTISAKRVDEGERKWLRRVLAEVGARIDVRPLLPDSRGLADYMLTDQYERMRCYLFHAKPEEGMAAPTLPDPEALALAYAQLIRIWRDIAHHLVGVRQGGIGVVTYEGFRALLFAPFSSGLGVVYSDARAPAGNEDTLINPGGTARIELENPRYQDGVMPGLVSVSASLPIEAQVSLPELWRFGCEVGSEKKLFCVERVEGGLGLSGVDQLDVLQVFRLKNASSPKLSF
ncbi:MAG TPA: hypothetical protein VFK31_04845 [Rhodanobacteraceae bacterium]|nr:hypothetical protein [Rhodanobacteraceae bacterium]HET8554906.1 hypothetical protein [Rhodanobacteraceae bacterium]